MKNEVVEIKWKRYQAFDSPSAAKQKGIRMEILLSKLTKVEYDEVEKKYWVMIAYGKNSHSINHTLTDYKTQLNGVES